MYFWPAATACDNGILRYVTGKQAQNTTPAPERHNAAAGDEKDIYVIAAHPHWRDSRVNRHMRDAALQVERVQLCDLYASYPDYDIDVDTEQSRLSAARLVVLLHPIHWYSMPALMKLWVDDVLTYGWAYGGGTALQGKDVWLVATTGGPAAAYRPTGYNRYFFDAFLPPYEQTAALCGMRFLPPMVLHGAHSTAPWEVDLHIETFVQRLSTYPHWPEMDELDTCPACAVPASDRPEMA